MLDDIIVLDMSRILAGPYCTMILADYGAQVIKIEAPGKGDDTRSWGPPFYQGESAYYMCCNRNKKSVTVNISTNEGQKIIFDLAKKADVFIENFKVDGLKKYGMDYRSISKLNPSIIYCSITGYGQTGPNSKKPGYDFIIQGISGLMGITGVPEESPMKVGVAISDILAGLFAANSILTSLYKRGKTGEGEYIDVSLLDTTIASLVNVASNHLVSRQDAKRFGNAHPNIVPYETFQASDGFFNIGVGNNRQFHRLCEVIGRRDLIEDDRFANNRDRVDNRNLLVRLISEKLSENPVQFWLNSLEKKGVPAGPINSIKEVFEEEQVRFRKMVVPVEHPLGGVVDLVNQPLKFDNFKPHPPKSPPLLGEHTDEILSELLGYDSKVIDQLKDKGVL